MYHLTVLENSKNTTLTISFKINTFFVRFLLQKLLKKTSVRIFENIKKVKAAKCKKTYLNSAKLTKIQ